MSSAVDRRVMFEKELVIYDNREQLEAYKMRNFQQQEVGRQNQSGSPDHRKFFRGAAMCLGLLCVLMMAGIIILSIQYVLVTTQKEQLQTRFNDLTNNNSQSQNEVKQLQGQITDMAASNRQLQDEIKKLKKKTKECPKGWSRFECSCYFKSTDKRKWSESRSFCQDRGSDLVIINRKEEQEYVANLSKTEESWIGLRTTENKTISTGFQWEWVDESPLKEMFWATAELGNATSWFAAVCCDEQGKWTRSGYNDNVYKNWICEK
ncbi:CD209 antigen-like protein E [Channa argus]|uniref:CD209 antigen-like protein E n=1 Tax=Channa argus TaxID=215402 RepID=UPI00352107B1